MTNNNHDKPDYDNFFLEIPSSDYLDDIEIQDEYDSVGDQPRGLSEDQLSEIARDSLEVGRLAQRRKSSRRRPADE